MKLTSLTLVAAAIALTSGAARASEQVKLRGYGTAIVDGVLTLNEWEDADRFHFQVDTSPAGGETVPATFYVMNDSSNLYIALRAPAPRPSNSALDLFFPAAPPAVFGPGSDILHVVPGTFEDLFFQRAGPYLVDKDYGGTRDGTTVVREADGELVYEVAHPLDSSDDEHDFSLTIPSHIEFTGVFQYCFASCPASYIPPATGEITIVSGTHVPPDTRFTFGPANGAELDGYGQFGFVGTDDIAPPSELTYECKLDARGWSECASPLSSPTHDEGWHTLSVRALDDMLNVDPTPSTRRWRIDTQEPSKPRLVVSSRPRGGTARFRLFATDRGTPARRLRYRCAVDHTPFRACGSRFVLRLHSGRHSLRVCATDPAGNRSAPKIVRFVVRRSVA
ncbi:MAG: hypothetical protein ABI896_01495 [Actinomycetota bacterium]